MTWSIIDTVVYDLCMACGFYGRGKRGCISCLV